MARCPFCKGEVNFDNIEKEKKGIDCIAVPIVNVF